MTDMVVTDAHHDEQQEVYRLTIGYARTVEVPIVDDEGGPVFSGYEDRPVVVGYDDEGEEITDTVRTPVGPPMTEQQTVLVPVEDFVFSAGDERWAGKTEAEIVKEQRRLVRAALRKREEDAAVPEVSPMPGVGDGL